MSAHAMFIVRLVSDASDSPFVSPETLSPRLTPLII
jgi:hypothetical protein